MSFRRVLFVSGHADDSLVGAGAYAFKLKKAGIETNHIVFTLSEKNNGVGFTSDELRVELESANSLVGFNHTATLPYPVHHLSEHGEEIRRDLTNIMNAVHPDLVLCPSLNDRHQDHAAVAAETIRVFRNSETVLSYELLRNSVHVFNPNVYAVVNDELEDKLKMIGLFKTQTSRPYMNLENFRALARMRGTQIGVGYAEAFECVKMVL